MWHQIIPLLISLSVFFSCEDAPVEEVLIEEKPECKPLIVSDSIFNVYYSCDTGTSNAIVLHERVYQNDTYNVSSVLGMQGQCFTIPIDVSFYYRISTHLIWDGQLNGDTASFLFLMYGDYTPNNLALMKVMKNPYDIDAVANLIGKSDFVVRLLYNKSNGIWEERFVTIHID